MQAVKAKDMQLKKGSWEKMGSTGMCFINQHGHRKTLAGLQWTTRVELSFSMPTYFYLLSYRITCNCHE